MICSSLSTLHGPAMTPTIPAPTDRLPATTRVGSGFTSRLATLYGATIGTTSATPGPLASDSFIDSRLIPTAAITVRSAPRITCALSPSSSTRPIM